MKIKIEMEIENCYDCPFKMKVYEHGYSAIDCTKLPPYHTIAQEGIRTDCPFLKQQEE
jgi:hypothetical protein